MNPFTAILAASISHGALVGAFEHAPPGKKPGLVQLMAEQGDCGPSWKQATTFYTDGRKNRVGCWTYQPENDSIQIVWLDDTGTLIIAPAGVFTVLRQS